MLRVAVNWGREGNRIRREPINSSIHSLSLHTQGFVFVFGRSMDGRNTFQTDGWISCKGKPYETPEIFSLQP